MLSPVSKDNETFTVYIGAFAYTGKRYVDAIAVIEKAIVYTLMSRNGGNKADVARTTGMSVSKVRRIFRKMTKEQQDQLIQGRYSCLDCGKPLAQFNQKYCAPCKAKKEGN